MAKSNTAVTEEPAKKYRFRVLAGTHTEGGKTYGKGTAAGQYVTTTTDLAARFNSPGAQKFEPVPLTANESSPEEDDGLDNMTVQELKDFAEEEEIDLVGASLKEDIIKKLRSALS